MPERKIISSGSGTPNQQVMIRTCSPLSHPGGSRLKEFAEDNFEIDENARKFPKQVEDTVGKGEKGRKHFEKRRNCSLQAISPFATVFSKGL